MNLDSFAVQSPCQNNGGCSQFCVLKPNGRTCICGAGWKLAEDGVSCKSLNLVVYMSLNRKHKLQVGYSMVQYITKPLICPLFQWYAYNLAKLSACIAKCMTTTNVIYFYIYNYFACNQCDWM